MAVIIDQSGPFPKPVAKPGEDILARIRGKLTLKDVADDPRSGRYASTTQPAPILWSVGKPAPRVINQNEVRDTQSRFAAVTPNADQTAAQTCNAAVLIQQGVAYDGVAVTFSQAFAATPVIIFSPGGLSYDSTLTGSQEQVFAANSITTTGFTPSLKIKQISSAQTNGSVNFSPYNTATDSATATLSVPSGTITNGLLTVNFTVTISGDAGDTVQIKDGSTIIWSKAFSSLPGGSTWVKSVAITDTSAINGTVITVNNVYLKASLKCTTVTYQYGTAATTHSATPSGAFGVPWTAYPPSV